MMRSNLHQLSTRFSHKLASTVVRPAAVVISGKISSFSTLKRGGEEDELYNFPDVFDESDSLEVGKKTLTNLNKEHAESDESGTSSSTSMSKQQQQSALGSRANDHDRIFRSLFGGFDDFFAPHPSLMSRDPFAPFFSRRESSPFLDSMSLLRNFPALHQHQHQHLHPPDATLPRSLSPGYEIKENEGTYEIAVHVPAGVKASDVAVEVENDGTVLYLSGERRQEDENGALVSETRFEKRFSIGSNVDRDNITANLSDGVLVLTAPKIETEQQKQPRTIAIAITENPHVASEEEVIQKSYSDESDESDWAEAGKQHK
jgi:HSP20 family molecular chaperone IbpA